MSKANLVVWGFSLIFWIGGASAQNIDPHAVYELSCAGCHAAHSGDFVFETLDLSEGTFVGKTSGRPLAGFLQAGHGKLSATEIDALMLHFTNISQSGRLFLERCRICHGNARDLARLNLVIRENVLVGRYSGRDTAAFLTNHGRLNPEEITTMVEVLERQLLTAGAAER